MFASRYFPDKYYAPRYFPKVGLDSIIGAILYNFFFSAYNEDDMTLFLTPLAVTTSDIDDENALMTVDSKSYLPDRIWVGAVGNVKLVLDDGTTHILYAASPGGWHKVPFFTGIRTTGTTATNISVTRERSL